MALLTEVDFGTPKVTANKQVTLTVDGTDISVPEGNISYEGCR